jgi:hypothetical protein
LVNAILGEGASSRSTSPAPRAIPFTSTSSATASSTPSSTPQACAVAAKWMRPSRNSRW